MVELDGAGLMNFVDALDAEIAELDASLRADSRYIKLQELRRIRSLYANNEEDESPDRTTNPIIERRGNVTIYRRTGRRPSPERQRAVEEAEALVVGRTAPTLTADILDHINRQGIKIEGANPQANLSSLLYRSGRFQSHGRNGWTLKPDLRNTEAAGAEPSKEPPAASVNGTTEGVGPQPSEPVEPGWEVGHDNNVTH